MLPVGDASGRRTAGAIAFTTALLCAASFVPLVLGFGVVIVMFPSRLAPADLRATHCVVANGNVQLRRRNTTTKAE